METEAGNGPAKAFHLPASENKYHPSGACAH